MPIKILLTLILLEMCQHVSATETVETENNATTENEKTTIEIDYYNPNITIKAENIQLTKLLQTIADLANIELVKSIRLNKKIEKIDINNENLIVVVKNLLKDINHAVLYKYDESTSEKKIEKILLISLKDSNIVHNKQYTIPPVYGSPDETVRTLEIDNQIPDEIRENFPELARKVEEFTKNMEERQIIEPNQPVQDSLFNQERIEELKRKINIEEIKSKTISD